MNALSKALIFCILFVSLTKLTTSENWDHCENEYYFGDGNRFIALHCVDYPPTIVNSLNNTEGVTVSFYAGRTVIDVEMDVIQLEPQEMIDYLDGLYYRIKNNKQSTTQFPSYPIPAMCAYDWGTQEWKSAYLINDQWFFDIDGKC